MAPPFHTDLLPTIVGGFRTCRTEQRLANLFTLTQLFDAEFFERPIIQAHAPGDGVPPRVMMGGRSEAPGDPSDPWANAQTAGRNSAPCGISPGRVSSIIEGPPPTKR